MRARIAWVAIVSFRRSSASANAPPTIGKTKGHEFHEPEHAHRERRPGEVVDLERDHDRDDLVAEVGDRPSDEQVPEVVRDPERCDVDEVPAGLGEPALGLRVVRG